MRTKTKLYLISGICGVLILLLAIYLKNNLSNQAENILYALGSTMFALGITKFIFSRYEEKNPHQMKQIEIEAKDERNTIIRYRAQAVAGLVLQWLAMGIAWVSIILDSSMWITLLGVGVFCGKTLLDFVLIEYYQRKM